MIRVLEVTWLMIGIISLLTGLYYTFARSLEDAYVFFIITAAAFLFYFLRRRQRIENDKEGI